MSASVGHDSRGAERCSSNDSGECDTPGCDRTDTVTVTTIARDDDENAVDNTRVSCPRHIKDAIGVSS